MKIYVVMDIGDYYGPYLEGIFATEEAALKHIGKRTDYTIDEYVLGKDGCFVREETK